MLGISELCGPRQFAGAFAATLLLDRSAQRPPPNQIRAMLIEELAEFTPLLHGRAATSRLRIVP